MIGGEDVSYRVGQEDSSFVSVWSNQLLQSCSLNVL